ncbi:CU044_2847 family protein [Streptomyces canus]|uniref:CU044_2847 family protein n=1 Tax=Streptomyces canus TaxID=58343 RepID=UPI00048C377A|nr:CU044_2847 family protein [Streptomyces canus]
MPELVELKLGDGTGVFVEVFSPASAPAADLDLPDGTGSVVPVGRGQRVAAATGQALSDVLRPLGSVLDSVHQAMTSALRPPDDVAVELGVRLSQDLKLGITSAQGEAVITVRATWKLGPQAG